MDAIPSMKYITFGQNYTHPLPVLAIFIFKNGSFKVFVVNYNRPNLQICIFFSYRLGQKTALLQTLEVRT